MEFVPISCKLLLVDVTRCLRMVLVFEGRRKNHTRARMDVGYYGK